MLYLSYSCPQIMPLCYLSSPYVTAVIHHGLHTHQETVKKVSGQNVEGAILQAVVHMVATLLSQGLQHADARECARHGAQVSGSPAYNGMSAAPSPFLNYSDAHTHKIQIPTDHLQLCRTQRTGHSHNMFQVLQSSHWYNTNFLPCFNHTFYFSKQIICSVLAKQYILV